MNESFKAFIIGLIVMSVILGIITYLLGLVLPAGFISPAVPSLILFFLVVTLLVHYILQKATGNNGRKFVNAFMLATLVKFFAYMPLIFVYMYFNRDDLLPFVIGFFVLYLCYTIFEVVSILRFSRTR